MKIALGLVHYPIFDQQKDIVATNITNLDVHDIARACRVYGIERYYLIHPMPDQLMFVSRMIEHWRVGDGAKFNPMRKTSLTMVHTAESVEKAALDWGGKPRLVATHARALDGVPSVTFRDLRGQIEASRGGDVIEKLPQKKDDERLFLLFGTGCGLTDDFMRGCDALLEPIRGASADDYRHLSVRSAVSICLDRLLGPW